MSDFDTRVNSVGRQRAIAFFIPRLALIALACFIFWRLT